MGFEESEIDAFYIDEQVEGTRKHYDIHGNLLKTRRLKPGEKIAMKLSINQ